MQIRKSVTLAAIMAIIFTACATPPAPIATTVPDFQATQTACQENAPDPVTYSILPTFTPAFPCELQNASNSIKGCLAYTCQSESIQETALGEGNDTVLIQHNYFNSTGCWSGGTTERRSLRVCDTETGETTTLAEDVLGEILTSPDGAWLAIVSAKLESNRMEPHIFRLALDGTEIVQLDTQMFPQDFVVGARILEWSEDGEWLEVSLWDGNAEGHYRYRLRTDGSGEFEPLP